MAQHRRKLRTADRRGAITVLAAIMMVMILAIAALSLDLGYLMMVNSELQRSADSAAMAACWDLIDDDGNLSNEIAHARDTANTFCRLNTVCAAAPAVDRNTSNRADGDIVVGYLSNPSNPACTMTFGDQDRFNSVQVTVRKTAEQNGEAPLFFARIFGRQSQSLQATATAALLNNVSGFKAPPAGRMLGILPIALDQETWNALLAGAGSDNWRWDTDNDQVTTGSDGMLEVNLYPQGTDAPGNRGTVDIGSSNNSTSDIARQITQGISAQDLSYLGGSIKFDGNGQLFLNGDTGISAGVKDELASIIGDPRIIPVFSSVSGPGNNATYTIVQFVGVRIMEVKLTGSMTDKRVIIQPANVIGWGALPQTGDSVTSTHVYSPVWLVR